MVLHIRRRGRGGFFVPPTSKSAVSRVSNPQTVRPQGAYDMWTGLPMGTPKATPGLELKGGYFQLTAATLPRCRKEQRIIYWRDARQRPGVYLMKDAQDQIPQVGKAKDSSCCREQNSHAGPPG